MAVVLTGLAVSMAALCIEAAAIGVCGARRQDADHDANPQACQSYPQRGNTPTRYLLHETPYLLFNVRSEHFTLRERYFLGSGAAVPSRSRGKNSPVNGNITDDLDSGLPGQCLVHLGQVAPARARNRSEISLRFESDMKAAGPPPTISTRYRPRSGTKDPFAAKAKREASSLPFLLSEHPGLTGQRPSASSAAEP